MRPVYGAIVFAVLIACGSLTEAFTIPDKASPRRQAEESDEEGERISIEEFYDRSGKADDLFPGARRGSYHFLIKGVHWTFLNDRWNDLYFDRKEKGDAFRAVLKSDPSLNFVRFDELCRWDKTDFFKVVVFSQGYLLISPESRAHKVVVPIPKKIAVRLEEFLRPDLPPPADE